jgi:hypothetical protein
MMWISPFLRRAQRVWLKSFDGSSWDWELIADSQGLPDDLLIEVLGSRKPVVFVEELTEVMTSRFIEKFLETSWFYRAEAAIRSFNQ